VDVAELVVALGSELLLLTGRAATLDEARRQLHHQFESGNALAKFREMVAAQGGDLDAPRPVASPGAMIASRASGFVGSIAGEMLGRAMLQLGAGRRRIGDTIDHAVGLEMLVRLGDVVEIGQPLARIFADAGRAAQVTELVAESIVVLPQPPSLGPLIAERIVQGTAAPR
jgi:thymidine phosphorylase